MKSPQKGDPLNIPATLWDQILKNNAWVERLRNSGSADLIRLAQSTGLVRVKNTSGSARDRFDVLGIDTVFPTPSANLIAFKSGPVLHGITPTIAAHSGKFVVLQEPAADDAIVTACVSGLTVAKLEVPSDVSDVRFADVKDSDASTLLASTRDGGARVLYRSTTWAIIRMDGAAALDVPIELKADLAKFGSANAYHLDDDGVRTATEETVYDIQGYYEGVGSAGSGVDDEGDKGWATRLSDGKLKVVALSCDPPGDPP